MTDADPPEWVEAAALALVEAAVAAELAEARVEGRLRLKEAFDAFADCVKERGDGLDVHWYYLAFLLASMVVQSDKEYYANGPTFLQLEDTVTGEVIDDPDEELADQPIDQAVVAAMRMVTAVGNDDPAMFNAVFNSAANIGTGATALFVMAEMAGWSWIEKLKQDGNLPEELAGQLAAREAGRIVELAAATADEPTVRTSPSGTRYRTLPADERDADDPLAAPHGGAVYGLTVYPVGDDAARQKAITFAHGRLSDFEGDDASLCGVEHAEDVQVAQVPYSAQRPLIRQLRKLKRQHGREFAPLRCWQHFGSCPE